MKTRVLLLLGGMLLLSSSMFGAPCGATQTVASLLASGCEIGYANFTIVFSNFVATGSATTANGDRSMTGAVGGNPLIGLGGFTFTNPAGNFPSAFTLGYTASLTGCTAGFTCAFTGYVEQTLIAPSSSGASVSVVESAGASPVVLNSGFQTSTQFPAFSVPTVTKLATFNGQSGLLSFESSVFATATATAIPEPLSLSLMGTGLIALGILGRKRVFRDQ